MRRNLFVIVLFLVFILLISGVVKAQVHTPEQWVKRYVSVCPKIPDGKVCVDKTKRNFKRMVKYRSMMFEKLDEYNLPRWLATIPFIESEYAPNAISKAGAVGLWQVMPWMLQYHLTTHWTAVNYIYRRKPKRNHAVKLGRDPEISTKVAVKILKHLYEKYGRDSHETVVRAYNAGDIRIDKNLKKKGKPLKPETLNYYNQLMALQILIDDMTSENRYKLR